MAIFNYEAFVAHYQQGVGQTTPQLCKLSGNSKRYAGKWHVWVGPQCIFMGIPTQQKAERFWAVWQTGKHAVAIQHYL